MGKRWCCFLSLLVFSLSLELGSKAQSSPSANGEVTVRFPQAVDSAAMRLNQIARGVVETSTNPALAKGTPAIVQLVRDPASGGFTLRLVVLGTLANGKLNPQGVPLEPIAGPHVLVPSNSLIRFTVAGPVPAIATAQTEQRLKPIPPRAPAHPASSVVDLPPAAPGYPPMHTYRAATEGCWWVPYVSEKYGLEMPIERCEKPDDAPTFVFGESDQGITYQSQAGGQGAPTILFHVNTKPSDQSILAAIQEQYIAKLKTPGAQKGCHVYRDKSGKGAFEEYMVEATGPYAKKFGPTSRQSPCPGLMGNEMDDVFFLYQPRESKTKFLFFPVDVQFGFDETALHFKAESAGSSPK